MGWRARGLRLAVAFGVALFVAGWVIAHGLEEDCLRRRFGPPDGAPRGALQVITVKGRRCTVTATQARWSVVSGWLLCGWFIGAAAAMGSLAEERRMRGSG